MIASQPTETRINLGEDGTLPELQLDEETKSDAAEEEGSKSNPLLLVVALCVSIGMSAVMFLIPDSVPRSESQLKADARAQIERHYTGRRLQGETITIDRYQELLREALQAHKRGDYVTERRRYRAVLRLLYAEDNTNTGLTGQVRAIPPSPPNDEHLTDLLSTLLRDD